MHFPRLLCGVLLARSMRGACGLSATATAAGSALSKPSRQTVLVEGFCRRIAECNHLAGDEGERFVPLMVGGVCAGNVLKANARAFVGGAPSAFRFDDEGTLRLAPRLESASAEERTAAVATAMAALREQGVVSGWRDELVPVCTRYDEPPVFLVERAAYPMLGVKGYGVHVNGCVGSAGSYGCVGSVGSPHT